MVKAVTLKCVAADALDVEYDLVGLDEQSTFYALECLINEVAPLVGPFRLKYASDMTNLEGRKTTSIKRMGIKNDTVIVFEPIDNNAARRKPEKVKETPELVRAISRRESTPFEYDVQGLSMEEITNVQEITLDGWDDDASNSDDDDNDLPEDAPPPGLLQRQRSWVVLGNMEINEREKDMIDQCTRILELSVDESVKLLRAHDWDLSKVLQQFTANPEKVLKEAGIKSNASPPESKEEEDQTVDEKDVYTCPLCIDEVALTDSHALDCGHRYCTQCWKSWLEAKFEDGPGCIFAQCMEFECTQVVPSVFFQQMVDKEKAAKIEKYVANAFVSRNAYIRWCPAKNCGRAVEYRKKGMKTVTCTCGYEFCFGCGEDNHSPAPCDVISEWNRKNKNESSIFEWIEKNKVEKDVKNCTKCHIVIEKNQGCKHMTCKNCKHEFCWLCYQNWRGHNETVCTEYQKKKDQSVTREKKENEGDETGDTFRRYQFYYTRFDNHAQAIKFAERIKGETEERMDKLQQISGEGRHRVQFLLNGVNEVIKCRKLLQWSYPWCFFLKEDSNLYRLFKGHQETLEKFTEELHELTEKPIEKILDGSTRRDIIDKTKVIERYRENIIEFARSNH